MCIQCICIYKYVHGGVPVSFISDKEWEREMRFPLASHGGGDGGSTLALTLLCHCRRHRRSARTAVFPRAYTGGGHAETRCRLPKHAAGSRNTGLGRQQVYRLLRRNVWRNVPFSLFPSSCTTRPDPPIRTRLSGPDLGLRQPQGLYYINALGWLKIC